MTKLKKIKGLLPEKNFPTIFYIKGERCIKDCNIYKCRMGCQWREHNNIIDSIGDIEIGLDRNNLEKIIVEAIAHNLKDLIVLKKND